MRKMLFILLLVISSITFAQTTAIPDTNFEQALINLGLDVLLDGQVLTANIDTVTILEVDSANISDLTGIQDFTALSTLFCFYNQLTSLDITQNLALTYLYASNNQLTGIDFTQNLNLFSLGLYNNLIASLDLSQNPNLTTLSCGSNQISTLDLSLQIQFGYLDCANNPFLQCLNMKNGNNQNVIYFNAINCPFSCVQVDSMIYSVNNWTNIDNTNVYAETCSICGFSGIEELPPYSLNIYPNPTYGQLTIPLKENKATTITIRNNLGQLLLSKNYTQRNQIDLDISSYPNGLYFVQVKTEDGIITKKIIKE